MKELLSASQKGRRPKLSLRICVKPAFSAGQATIGSQESIAQTFTQLLHHTATTRHRIAQDKQSFSIAKTFSAASLPLVVEWNMSQPELQGWCLVTATSLRVSLQIEDDAWPSHLNELTVRQAGISQQRSKLGKMVMARHHPRTFNLSLDSVSGQAGKLYSLEVANNILDQAAW